MDHAVLAGDSLYWQLIGNFQGILQFDLERQRLFVMPVPVPIYSKGNCFKLMRAEGGGGGGIGFLFMSNSDYVAQLWRRKTDADGVASWVIRRSIELHKLLSLRSGDGEYMDRRVCRGQQRGTYGYAKWLLHDPTRLTALVQEACQTQGGGVLLSCV